MRGLELRVASCDQDSDLYHATLPALIRLLFYRADPFVFVALVDNTLTLVLQNSSLSDLFGEAMLNLDSAVWGATRIEHKGGGLGYEEAGIVTLYARPLVEQRQLPLYYVSTYLTDYILV